MDVIDLIRALVEKRLNRGSPAGLVVGLTRGSHSNTWGWGRSATSRSAAPDGSTLFEIGSLTKAFTGLALALLKKEGLVAFSDPVRRHLPEGSQAASRNGKVIRLLHLATHTSGLPRLPSNLKIRDPLNPYAEYTERHLLDFIARARLRRDPGDGYEYSNVGGGLLGYALSRAAGLPYEDLIAQRICRPLGMTDTRITLSEEQRSRFAQGHDASGRAVPAWDIPALPGAGALRSTANDLLRFLAAHLAGAPEPLLGSIAEARSPHARAAGVGAVGLGWHLSSLGTSDAATLVWHNGGTGGFSSFAGYVLERSLGVVVLSNSSTEVDSLAHSILRALEVDRGRSGSEGQMAPSPGKRKKRK